MSIKRQSHRISSKLPPPSGRKPTSKLTTRVVDSLVDELCEYHRQFADSFQRREQRHWSLFYLCGQLSNLERKTIEPMVLELLGPDTNAVRALDQFIGAGQWAAQKLIVRLQTLVARVLGHPDGVVIVDGSGFPKQGQHSVATARQYCGAVGKVANCQQGVFAVYASPQGHTFIDCRLYVHESWFGAEFRHRWQQCRIPSGTTFHTEPQLALELVQGLAAREVLPFRWVAADEHFGQNPAFLDGVAALHKWYVVEVPADTRVWLRTPAIEPPGPSLWGRPRTKPRIVLKAPRPQEVRQLGAELPRKAWKRYWIKEGSQGPMVAEFAFLRVTSIREQLPGPRVWLMVRRSLGTEPQVKFFFSNAPTTIDHRDLAQLSGWRWPIETTLEEGKGEVGMDQYETRTWQGWHHQMAQSFLAHFFLVHLQLQFKKRPGVDHRPSAQLDCQCPPRGRCALGQDARHCRISPETESCHISFTSHSNRETPSPSRFYPAKAQSLQVI